MLTCWIVLTKGFVHKNKLKPHLALKHEALVVYESSLGHYADEASTN